jgi:hypothetical protein
MKLRGLVFLFTQLDLGWLGPRLATGQSALHQDPVRVAIHHGARPHYETVEVQFNICFACACFCALTGIAAQRRHPE